MTTAWICVTCGVQQALSTSAPERCPICEDERQYVRQGGQAWTTLEDLAAGGHRKPPGNRPARGAPSLQLLPLSDVYLATLLIKTVHLSVTPMLPRRKAAKQVVDYSRRRFRYRASSNWSKSTDGGSAGIGLNRRCQRPADSCYDNRGGRGCADPFTTRGRYSCVPTADSNRGDTGQQPGRCPRIGMARTPRYR